MDRASVVPQVFYDVIARIVPGATLIGTGYFVWVQPAPAMSDVGALLQGFSSADSSTFLTLLVCTLASYILALSLQGLFDVLLRYVLPHSWQLQRRSAPKVKHSVVQHFSSLPADGDIVSIRPTEATLPDMRLMYDSIRLREASAGARLVKLRAECTLCRTLTYGWLTLLPFSLTGNAWKHGDKGGWIVTLVICFGLLGITCRYVHLTRRYLRNLCYHWVLLRFGV